MTVVSTAAVLAACGGGSETSPTSSESFVARIATETPVASRLPAAAPPAPVPAAAPVATVITNDQLFQWAQLQFPQLFGSAAPSVISNLPYNGKLFDVRAFVGGAYLGISDGHVYGLGSFTNGQLTDFGVVQTYSTQVCSLVSCTTVVNPGGGSVSGALNGCTMPASQALQTGSRYTSVYVSDVLAPLASSGEYSTEGVVDGSSTFEGQAAIKVTSRVRGVQLGQSTDATVISFQQIADNDLSRMLGSESVVSFSGLSMTSRTVNNPAYLNSEFTLQLGQSMDKTYTSTASFINSSFSLPPTTTTSTSKITYEARENISVLGRSYDTCRYKTTTPDNTGVAYVWYVYGQGIPAQVESRTATGAVQYRTSLKSATINGAAI